MLDEVDHAMRPMRCQKATLQPQFFRNLFHLRVEGGRRKPDAHARDLRVAEDEHVEGRSVLWTD